MLRAVTLPTRAVGTREAFREHVGKRVRKIFFVAPEDLEREDAWVEEPGWYVMTVRPPASWRFNDPMGPYATVDELRADAFPALEYVDDSE